MYVSGRYGLLLIDINIFLKKKKQEKNTEMQRTDVVSGDRAAKWASVRNNRFVNCGSM